MIANREITEEEFEFLVLMYVREPPMYPLDKAEELFDQGLFESSGQFCYVEQTRKGYPKGEAICGVMLAQQGVDLVDQADPVKVVRIWIENDFIAAATGWIRSKMSREQLPEFLSHESQEVRRAAFSRLQDLVC